MNRRTAHLAMCALAAAFFAVATGPTARAQSSNRVPFAQTVLDRCSGANILITGTSTTTTDVTFDGAFGFHIRVHLATHGTGANLATGDDYVLNFVGDAEYYFSGNDFPYNIHVSEMERMIDISNRGADSFFTQHVWLTVDAAGNVIRDLTDFESGCAP